MDDIVNRLMKSAQQLLDDRLCAEFGPGGGNPNAKIEDGLEYKAAQEIKKLRQWIDDLQSGMYINCVYCGHQYGPKDEVPASMSEVLKEHVESCPEHPMSKLKQENAKLREKLDTLQSDFHAISEKWYCYYIDKMRSKGCLGVDEKIRTNKFRRAELEDHNEASEMLGWHRAFHSAAKQVKMTIELEDKNYER